VEDVDTPKHLLEAGQSTTLPDNQVTQDMNKGFGNIGVLPMA